MQPKEFLLEEFDNVKRALSDTLRFDYGPPALTKGYYEECAARLAIIGKELPKISDLEDIWALLGELNDLARWISYIERSKLGEFSWPFADEIRKIAKPLLSETTLSGNPIEPIIHVVAAGEGYQIDHEGISSSVKSRFAIVAFPRSLKHHVLLHTIFGHELGHTALRTAGSGREISTKALRPLAIKGHLQTVASMTAWLNSAAAPAEVKADLVEWRKEKGIDFAFDEYYRKNWLVELICDLIGLLLFGPAFAAAHKALLLPLHRTPYEVPLYDPTHPPYAIRHKLIVRAMKVLDWHLPVTTKGIHVSHGAEEASLKYIMEDPYSDWAAFFDDQQLKDAIVGLQEVLAAYGDHGYRQPNAGVVESLVARLRERTPPIMADISAEGDPQLNRTALAHTLYAGWVYWLGRDTLSVKPKLSFLHVNGLCDQALLQECGISQLQ